MAMMMIVIMVVVAVIMVVIVLVAMAVPIVGLGVKLLNTDRLFRDLGEFGDEIDHLVLEQGGAQFGKHLRIIAVKIVDLPLLAGILADALEERAVDLFIAHFDLVAGADLRQNEAEPDAPRGNAPVIFLGLLLSRAFVLEAPLGPLKIAGDLAPDRFEFVLHQGWRQLEIIIGIQLIE